MATAGSISSTAPGAGGAGRPPGGSASAGPVPEEDLERIRSWYSDKNEYYFDRMKLKVYKDDVGIENADLMAADIDNISPAETIDLLREVEDSLTKRERREFNTAFSDRALVEQLEGREMARDLMPPLGLVDLYGRIGKSNLKGRAKRDAERKVLAQMVRRTRNITERNEEYYIDLDNIADVHRGYMAMFDFMVAHSGELDDEQIELRYIRVARRELNRLMREYDEIKHIDGRNVGRANDAVLNRRALDSRKALEPVEISEGNAVLLGKFRFLDEAGKAVPQFVNDAGEEHLEYRSGDHLIGDRELHQYLDVARHEELESQVGQTGALDKNELTRAVNERLPLAVCRAYVAKQVKEGLAGENQHQFDPKYRARFIDEFVSELENGEVKELDREYTIATIDERVNSAGAFMERLAEKVGDDAEVLRTLHEDIEKFDKRAADRFEPEDDARKYRRKFGKSLLKQCLATFGISTAFTIARHLPPPAGLIATGAGIALTIGASAMAIAKKTNELHKKHKKVLSKEGLSEVLPAAATAALSTGALLFGGLGGSKKITLGMGLAAMAAGALQSAVSKYGEAKKHGAKTGEAIAHGALAVLANAGAGFGGKFFGDWAAGQLAGIGDPAENPLHEYKGMKERTETETRYIETPGSERDITLKTYGGDAIARAESIIDKGEMVEVDPKSGDDFATYSDYRMEESPDNFIVKDHYTQAEFENALRNFDSSDMTTKYGWKEGNGGVFLKNLASELRLLANQDAVDKMSGHTIRDLTNITASDGSVSSPEIALGKMISPSARFTQADMEVLSQTADIMSSKGEAVGVDVGITKADLYSYNPGGDTGVESIAEKIVIPPSRTPYQATSYYYEPEYGPRDHNLEFFAMPFVFPIFEKLKGMKKRIGALADKIKKRDKMLDDGVGRIEKKGGSGPEKLVLRSGLEMGRMREL